MFLEPFYTADGDSLRISADQGSRFAKEIAGDFNPIHDQDNKRFCVPGDLLFALVLARQGLAQRMDFVFSSMVGANQRLRIPSHDPDAADSFMLCDDAERPVLTVRRGGEHTRDMARIERLVRAYVAFSGHNFPHFLVPLMKDQRVMVNTERPLVIYEGMSFDLRWPMTGQLGLELLDSQLAVQGRRGSVRLSFELRDDKGLVGAGEKRLVLSGLRDLDQSALDGLVTRYARRRATYQAAA